MLATTVIHSKGGKRKKGGNGQVVLTSLKLWAILSKVSLLSHWESPVISMTFTHVHLTSSGTSQRLDRPFDRRAKQSLTYGLVKTAGTRKAGNMLWSPWAAGFSRRTVISLSEGLALQWKHMNAFRLLLLVLWWDQARKVPWPKVNHQLSGTV